MLSCDLDQYFVVFKSVYYSTVLYLFLLLLPYDRLTNNYIYIALSNVAVTVTNALAEIVRFEEDKRSRPEKQHGTSLTWLRNINRSITAI